MCRLGSRALNLMQQVLHVFLLKAAGILVCSGLRKAGGQVFDFLLSRAKANSQPKIGEGGQTRGFAGVIL